MLLLHSRMCRDSVSCRQLLQHGELIWAEEMGWLHTGGTCLACLLDHTPHQAAEVLEMRGRGLKVPAPQLAHHSRAAAAAVALHTRQLGLGWA